MKKFYLLMLAVVLLATPLVQAQGQKITNRYSMSLKQQEDGTYKLAASADRYKFLDLDTIPDLLTVYQPRPIAAGKHYKHCVTEEYLYKSYPTYDLKLEIDRAVTTEPAPFVVYIHGGGWVSGITTMRNRYISQWAQKGFFTASIGYTWAPDKIYPAQLFEVFKAIDQILDSAEENNFDPQNVVIAGESAGGYYITYVASCFNDKSILDALGIEFRHFGKAKINALVSICGCFDLQRLTDPQKEQSEFPDMKMMATTFLGKSIEETREYLSRFDCLCESTVRNSSAGQIFLKHLLAAHGDILKTAVHATARSVQLAME